MTSHPDLSSDLPRSLPLGPSGFPSQRVCGPLALNEKYAMPETVIDVSLENLKSIAWLETSWKELEARVDSARSFCLGSGSALGYGISRMARNHTSSSLGRQARSLAWRLFAGGERGSLGPHARARWLLNETGDTRSDRLFIEYNNILARAIRCRYSGRSRCVDVPLAPLGIS